MAKPDISLLGATYSGVSGVALPVSGGGVATFPWVEGSETKTQNGTYDVTTLAELIVNVSGSTIEMESGTWTPSSDVARGDITFTKTHTKPPTFAVITCAGYPSASSNVAFAIIDTDALLGVDIPYSSSAYRHALAVYTYRPSSGSNTSVTGYQVTYGATNTGSTSATYYRYYATATKFTPYTGSAQRYWRSGTTYTWKAYWL